MSNIRLRCHECDTVKKEKCVEVRGKGDNICDECKGLDVPDIPDKEEKEENEENEDGITEEKIEEKSSDNPTENEKTTDDDERDKKTLEETFSEQDPLEW